MRICEVISKTDIFPERLANTYSSGPTQQVVSPRARAGKPKDSRYHKALSDFVVLTVTRIRGTPDQNPRPLPPRHLSHYWEAFPLSRPSLPH